uniref:Uncharacterized protein n=1 Tax=Setaria viridis TaxID=4556 RepID=A0A4U6VE03_SETVI|nr:hypothetical protein SEVIR_3G120500v2 [Setaria viridis]
MAGDGGSRVVKRGEAADYNRQEGPTAGASGFLNQWQGGGWRHCQQPGQSGFIERGLCMRSPQILHVQALVKSINLFIQALCHAQHILDTSFGNTSSCLVIMDPKHSAESVQAICRHLDKQNQALMGTYRAMSHELHKLQLYELMSAEGLVPKRKKEKKQEEKDVESTLENKEWEP